MLRQHEEMQSRKNPEIWKGKYYMGDEWFARKRRFFAHPDSSAEELDQIWGWQGHRSGKFDSLLVGFKCRRCAKSCRDDGSDRLAESGC